MTGYFGIVNTSSPHIYHSALVVAPNDSIVRKLYESYAHPLIRIVCGAPTSWDASTAATARPSDITSAVWSPCNRFVAIIWGSDGMVEVLDSATLQRLQNLESPDGESIDHRKVIFSPDSRVLTCLSCYLPNQELFVVSWDLQTGGVASVIRWQEPTFVGDIGTLCITYSTNGQMVGIYYSWGPSIFICDVVSGTLVYSHSFDNGIPPLKHIWTHGESLRFAISDAAAITIWEVKFTSGATPVEVETFPTPGDLYDFDDFEDLDDSEDFRENFHGKLLEILVFSTPYRVALTYQNQVRVWDVRTSSYLLEYTGVGFAFGTTFSPDGCFFACSTWESDVYLWKESPAGYKLHGIFTSSAKGSNPLLSPNGESIVVFAGRTTQLWPTSPFSILTRAPQRTENFALEFSPDRMLAVVAMQKDNTATVLNLESGVPQLTIDAKMEVYGLGMIGNSVVVIGDQEVVAWNLPGGDFVASACVSPEDSSWTINLGDSQHNYTKGASISPDSRHVAFLDLFFLHIHSASTGELLWKEVVGGDVPWFSIDGCHICCVENDGEAIVWRVSEGRRADGTLIDMEHPPEGYPWVSSRGYCVTDDWWILGPGGKRLLLLPPPWQSFPVRRIWKGQFLALLHRGLPEVVILDFEVNHDP